MTRTTTAPKRFEDWKPDAKVAVLRLIGLVEGSTLTQEQHAFGGGFNSRTFRRWLNKETEPTGENLKALTRYIVRAK